MRFMALFLCCSIVAFAQDKPAPTPKADEAKPGCGGCGGCDDAAAQCGAKAAALVAKIKATEDLAACAKMLLAEVPGFKCEATATQLVAKIKATEDGAACSQMVCDLAAKCAPKTAGCCGDSDACDNKDCEAKFGAENAAKLVATIKATENAETCAQMLLAEVPGFACEKTAGELVAKIKANADAEASAQMLCEVAKKCATSATCPTALKLVAAIRVMKNDEVAASVLVAEIKGLGCKVMAGKLVAALKGAESDVAAAAMLMKCASRCAAGGCAGKSDGEGCGSCEKGCDEDCGSCEKAEPAVVKDPEAKK